MYCCAGGVPGKASNLPKQLEVIKSAILTQKYLTIEAQIHEAEGPKNVRMKMVTMKEPKDRHR